jgi:hypothetical protein
MSISMPILLDGARRCSIRQSHITTAVLPDDGDAVFFWGETGSALSNGRFAVAARHARR